MGLEKRDTSARIAIFYTMELNQSININLYAKKDYTERRCRDKKREIERGLNK